MIILTLKRKFLALFIVAVFSIMTRQNLFVLAILSFLSLYVATKENVALAYLVSILILFGLLVSFTGKGDVTRMKTAGIILCDFDVNAIIGAIIETRFPIMFSPFLLLLVCFAKQTIKYVKKYWWVSLYAMITITQPFLCYKNMGWYHTQRLSMMGVWLSFLLAGLLLRDTLKSQWSMWVYGVLPLLYGTKHLSVWYDTQQFNAIGFDYPSIVGHRTVLNVIILFLVLIDMHYKRKYDK